LIMGQLLTLKQWRFQRRRWIWTKARLRAGVLSLWFIEGPFRLCKTSDYPGWR
jgi:hypothetical protein